jgi:hypothetical protein
MSDGIYSWQLTERERRRALTATLAAAATFVGPLGPLMVWAFDYLYDRRDLIFNQVGTPVQAYGADRSAVGLNTLAGYGTDRSATLSIDTPATGSNLRLGDPVSMVLSEHSGGQLRNGLVVPTRVGERVSLSLPRGSYSLAAFGGRRETLFTTRDPYSALGGDNLVLDGQRQLYLPLSARTPTPSVTSPLLSHQLAASRPFNPLGVLPRRTCPSCGSTLSANGICPQNPRQPAFRCRSCTQRFRSHQARHDHERNMHWTAWDFIQDFFGNR